MLRFALTTCVAFLTAVLSAQDQVHYRFEEGEGIDVIDELSGDVHGELVDSPEFSDDVPDCLDGENEFSIDFTVGGFALMNGGVGGVPFMFHDPAAGGAAGDATTEWFIKVPFASSHASMIWSNGDDDSDANRFNISHDLSCCGLPADFAAGDYRDRGGRLGGIGSSTHRSRRPIPYDEWVHIAITRTDFGDGSWGWEWYYNGEHNPVQSAVTVTALPTAQSWLIAGRSSGHSFNALMDEVRLTAEVLEPEEFLCGSGCDAGEPDGEVSCADGVDNDCDGATDGEDDDCPAPGVGPFIRGDCDGNGVVGGTPTEAIVLLNFAFRGAVAPGCVAACDAEANGSIGVTDALRILRFAFLGVGVPDAPFPDCTRSALATDIDLGCEVTACTP